MEADVPEHLEGLTLRITYHDEERQTHSTIVEINNGQLINRKE